MPSDFLSGEHSTVFCRKQRQLFLHTIIENTRNTSGVSSSTSVLVVREYYANNNCNVINLEVLLWSLDARVTEHVCGIPCQLQIITVTCRLGSSEVTS